MGRTVLTAAATTERPYVSKSKFLWCSQCRKLLWFAYNAKDQIPEPDAAPSSDDAQDGLPVFDAARDCHRSADLFQSERGCNPAANFRLRLSPASWRLIRHYE